MQRKNNSREVREGATESSKRKAVIQEVLENNLMRKREKGLRHSGLQRIDRLATLWRAEFIRKQERERQ